MSKETPLRIFFLKSTPTDLQAVETYLTKRDYEVMSESDFKKALEKIIQFDPHFVFLAWDHPSGKIQSAPRLINQSNMSTIVPYIQSSAPDLIQAIEASGFNHKLFPPISGPAIIRTVLKMEKENADKNGVPADESIHVKSKNGEGTDESSLVKVRGELLKNNQERLKNLDLKKLDPTLKKTLKEDFESTIKNKIIDVSQTYQGNDTVTHLSADAQFKKILCLIVQSEAWCGYLMVASHMEMNNDDFQEILQEWLKSQMVNRNEIADSDYFEITLDNTQNINLKKWAQDTADYLEVVDTGKGDVLVCFFPIEPKYLIVEANESYEMLEVPLRMVIPDKNQTLSLFLHLPDNKKYILYTPANQAMSPQQKNKLVEKNIERLYTPLDFEKELNKLKAEYYLNESIKKVPGT